MIKTKLSFKTDNAGIFCGVILLATLTDFSAHGDGLHVGVNIGVPAIIVAPPEVVVAPPAVVVQDDYVFYPDYNVYYNSTRHQYAYMEGGAWVSRPAPFGVSANVLLASPSVHMDFHDSPANHHSEMIQKYPKGWSQSHVNDGRNDGRKQIRTDDKRDKRDDRGERRGDDKR